MEIPASELIINPDGSIYHLNILPEDIAETIITVGDQDRVPEVSKYFDIIEIKKHKREFCCHTGYLNGKRLSVISSGIGTDNIDIVINEIDALFNIDLSSRAVKRNLTQLKFYRLGTSGSIQRDVPVESFVVSRCGISADNLNLFYNIPESHHLKDLSERLQNVFGANSNFYAVKGSDSLLSDFTARKEFIPGNTYSAIGFYGPQGRSLRNQLVNTNFMDELVRFNEGGQLITNIEMETSGIYLLAANLGHEALSINVILANRSSGQFSKAPKIAIDKLIKTSLEIITG